MPIRDYIGNRGLRCANCGTWILCHCCGNYVNLEISHVTNYDINKDFCCKKCEQEYARKSKVDNSRFRGN